MWTPEDELRSNSRGVLTGVLFLRSSQLPVVRLHSLFDSHLPRSGYASKPRVAALQDYPGTQHDLDQPQRGLRQRYSNRSRFNERRNPRWGWGDTICLPG
jgi:hypothetical protein